jgi:Response regulator containing CheY-like receiver, AAA-type ATPase, and DNA-binding domains
MPAQPLRILLVEDSPADVHLIEVMLRPSSFEVTTVRQLSEALPLFHSTHIDVILLDLTLPDSGWPETLQAVLEQAPGTAIVVITGNDDEQTALDAVAQGAQDYLVKGKVDGEAIVRSIRYAFARNRTREELRVSEERFRALVENSGRKRVEELVEENVLLRNEIDERLLMGSVIGVSRAIRSVLSNVDKVAPTDATVLITGETGTGKELIAREIHRRSSRAAGPVIAVHSAALPASLIASELFGHERGAFTGAMQQRIGRFELASRGSIFLDEVGDLPAEMQVALLRVLQERTFERVGGTQTLHTDARVIAATNRDLLTMVGEAAFRNDLFYRLSVFPIHIPPLRERREDIPPLVEHFAKTYARRFDKPIARIPQAGMARLVDYAWPGNVRELENVVERAVILAPGDELVIAATLFPGQAGQPILGGALPLRLGEMEKSAIEHALKESGGRVGGASGAAAHLGIRPTTLYSKLRKHHIDPARFKPPR